MAGVSTNQLGKYYGDVKVLHDITLQIDDGEFVTLVGPSGCGKSTLLRMIAGLEDVTEGEIKIGEKVVNDIPPKKREIAMVFQNYALYPHFTVEQNMSFGLKLAGIAKDEVARRIKDAAEILGLEPYLSRKPGQLSGGQRQRVAMGRAIVRDPQVFLFDEPLSNLDAKLRVKVRSEIKDLQRRLKTTTIYVTHDQIEAMTMADKIVIMREGRIEQVGTPDDLYNRPANIFVAGFIGSPAMNLFDVEFKNGTTKVGGVQGLKKPDETSDMPDGHVTLGVRPEDFRVEMEVNSNSSGLRVTIRSKEPTGPENILICDSEVGEIVVVERDGIDVSPGQSLILHPDMSKIHRFDVEDGQRLSE